MKGPVLSPSDSPAGGSALAGVRRLAGSARRLDAGRGVRQDQVGLSKREVSVQLGGWTSFPAGVTVSNVTVTRLHSDLPRVIHVTRLVTVT